MGKISKANLRIAILGPGGVGSLVAALFWRAGYQVVCVGSKRSVDSIGQDGVFINSKVYGEFIAYPSACEELNTVVDVIFVTVKSPYLEDALKRVATCAEHSPAIVSLLNGVGHRELIRRIMGPNLVVGAIGAIEVFLEKNRIVQHLTSMIPHIDIASDSDVSQDEVKSIALALNEVGLSASVLSSENQVIWWKLVRLCAIATMTTFCDSCIGVVRSDAKLRDMMVSIIEEIIQIASEEGVSMQVEDVLNAIDKLPEKLTTSMQRDIKSGLPSEIESIVGGVIRLGNQHKLTSPVLEKAYVSIRQRINS